jgi:deoxyribodipyrimidine photo-lyase
VGAEATRAAGLARLEEFAPRGGIDYARDRNIDGGLHEHSVVSGLSPWIRRRLVTEAEAIRAVLARHGAARAEKFNEEVCWRSYWKGWLELRPSVYRRFERERTALDQRLSEDGELAAAHRRATEARSGIVCFDSWAAELVATGWLHNHARMWFASIWIFTLRLPWQLGAAFFYEHLLDGDPASNTLSWRWVAGLHTPGKHYLARAENIQKYTRGRFHPAGQLAERAPPLAAEATTVPMTQLPAPGAVNAARVGLLLTEEDLQAETWNHAAQVVGIAALPDHRSALDAPRSRFTARALADGLERAAAHFTAPLAAFCAAPAMPAADAAATHAEQLVAWAQSLAVSEIVTAYAPVGPTADRLDVLELRLRAVGIRLVRLRRPWDTQAWPHAVAGFYKFKQAIPALIEGLAGAAPQVLGSTSN